MCTEHTDRPVEYLCKDDDASCASCSTDHHGNCKQVQKIGETASNFFDKDECCTLKRNIKKLSLDVQSKIEERNVAMTECKNQKSVISEKIVKMQSRLVTDLHENLENDKNVVLGLTEVNEALDALLVQIDFTMKFCHESQIYVFMRKLKKEFVVLENKYNCLNEIVDAKKAALDSKEPAWS